MAKIFCTKTIPKESWTKLKEQGHEINIWDDKIHGPISYEELLKQVSDCQALACMLSDRIDRNLIEHAPQLKVISQYAVGHNNIDTKFANERGIIVTNTPDVLTHATAELAFALLLSCARKIIPASKNVEEDQWQGWEPLGFLGKSLKNSTVAIIGAGRIGQEFAKMCHGAFNSKIVYVSRSTKEGFEKSFNAQRMELKEALSQADIISLHCPLTEQTRELLNNETLSYCKDDAIIINTARGEVINQEHLIENLKVGKFHSIGLDVTTPEPLPENHPLKQFNNVLIVPHIGSATEIARKEMGRLVCQNIENVLSKISPITPVTT